MSRPRANKPHIYMRDGLWWYESCFIERLDDYAWSWCFNRTRAEASS